MHIFNPLLDKSLLLDSIERVKPQIHRTPILTSQLLNRITGADLYFKCDNFQRGGSYKIRGAVNAVLQLSSEKKERGVITHSSGNFGAALTLAARNLGVKAYVVMPENSPKAKQDAVRDYGAEITLCPNSLKDREEYTERIIATSGATLIHPSNDQAVILGQATMTAELIEEVEDLDLIVCPIGGGGVGAGACLSAHYLGAGCKVIGAEPSNASDAFRSLKEGRIMPSINPDTIADGLRSQLGDQTYPILKELLERIILVSEEEIVCAMRLVWERMKIVIEPSSAVTLAAILSESDSFNGKKVGLIITGGNVSLDNLPF